jgi:GxxExxY protein
MEKRTSWAAADIGRCATQSGSRNESFSVLRGAPLAPEVGMPVDPSTFNDVTRDVIGAAIEVHRTLGPGLLESTYLECLEYELARYRLRFERQRRVPIVYKGIPLRASYRIDLIVEDRVIVEVKSVAGLAPVHFAQVLTYLRLTGCPAGLLINFNVARVMDGVKRVLNPFPREVQAAPDDQERIQAEERDLSRRGKQREGEERDR